MRNLRNKLKEWVQGGQVFALATVVSTQGSSPRVPGSCLIISRTGDSFAGAVSSGCLEHDVLATADQVLAAGQSRLLAFGPEGLPPWIDGLSCGGGILVRVEPWWAYHPRAEPRGVSAFVLEQLNKDSSFVVLTRGECHLAMNLSGDKVGDLDAFTDEETRRALARLESGAGFEVEGTPRDGLILRIVQARRRLVVVGAVEIALRLVPLAQQLGFKVQVVDPRKTYAQGGRFPNLPDELVCEDPAEWIRRQPPGPRDAALVLSHDPKLDDPALSALLEGKAGYIGALGSVKSHSTRLQRLKGRGFEEPALARIEGPAGLRLGKAEPGVIALGMLAGIVQTFGGE